MPTNEEITAMIEEAWDEVAGGDSGTEPEPQPETEESEQEQETEEEQEETGDDDDEEADEDDGEEQEPEDEEPEDAAAAFESDDPEIIAFLSKYENDPAKALKGAVELSRVLGKQGNEKAELQEQVDLLSGELSRLQAFSTGTTPLSEEQRNWVEEALTSGNPAGYVQLAVDENQFELARAVCRDMARDDPYNAIRLGQQVDQIEQQVTSYVPPWDMDDLLTAMREQFPDMPHYEQQMTDLVHMFGPEHPAVIDARSDDARAAARGIHHLYDVARASSASVRTAKREVRDTERENGASVRRAAKVQSSETSPSSNGTPRRETFLMPGLTMEALEAELERASQ